MKICIVGEAWGEQEELTKRPFMGAAGQELRKMLKEAGYTPASIFYTNVFNFRPRNNDLRTLCLSKPDAIKALALLKAESPSLDLPAAYTLPPLGRAGEYLHPKYLPGLSRLHEELSRGWDLVIAVGNTALWAICNTTGIGRARGYMVESPLCPGAKIMPTYHPSAVLRNWSLRPIVIADLIKARGGREDSQKEIWINPGLSDIRRWFQEKVKEQEPLAIDIETKPSRRIITCVGFGTKIAAISIPFSRWPSGAGNYWPTIEEEVEAWTLVRYGMTLPNPKVWQNGCYDIQWLWRFMGMVPSGTFHDTMLIHHALQPEMEKSLEFLGSVYLDTPAWKRMRKGAKLSINSEKRDD